MTVHPPADVDRINAVTRALSLLDSFLPGESQLSLAELCRRTGIPKTSVLRSLRTLEGRGYLLQAADGAWRLGPACAKLAGCYEGSFDADGIIRSALIALADSTRKSATFFVDEGSVRVLLMKVQHHEGDVPLFVGQARPLDRGAAGKVILAHRGQAGMPFDAIRQRGFDFTLGEINTSIASLAAAVNCSQRVLGSVCLSARRDSDAKVSELESAAPAVIAAARKISSALTRARQPAGHPTNVRYSSWHP